MTCSSGKLPITELLAQVGFTSVPFIRFVPAGGSASPPVAKISDFSMWRATGPVIFITRIAPGYLSDSLGGGCVYAVV